jgi:4-amino-4-deoxy-L-arabinose transferase-like glycosyltransferase
MFFPLLQSSYSPYFGSIAKHIVSSNNWTDLVLLNHDWLDKPHFPFWITALAFKLLGINSVAYILPGFLFNLCGIYYTYRLSRLWYSKQVGLLAALFTSCAFHLMLSAIDVRAEAYLIGEIMPACYYWLKYDRNSKIKYLLLGAIFTALALMTKGIFIIITITSGLIAVWIYQGQIKKLISFKWLMALALCFIFIAPEIYALYVQFDLHPQKIVFGHNHVSGIRWYFWDSQFGRFFGTGPIMSSNPPPWHELFFVHTFLWAYLPWWPMFVAALVTNIKQLIINKFRVKSVANVFLFNSFFVTFILFSLTKFQVDHYTNIIFPFASIICANWFINITQASSLTKIYYIENIISAILLLVVLILTPLVLSGSAIWLMEALLVIGIILIIKLRSQNKYSKTLYYPSITICLVFVFVTLVNGTGYVKYDAGYQIATYLNRDTNIKLVGYDIDILGLNLYSHNQYQQVDDLQQLATIVPPYYLITQQKDQNIVQMSNKHHQLVTTISGGSIEDYLHHVLNKKDLAQDLNKYVILQVEK